MTSKPIKNKPYRAREKSKAQLYDWLKQVPLQQRLSLDVARFDFDTYHGYKTIGLNLNLRPIKKATVTFEAEWLAFNYGAHHLDN